MKCKLCPWQTDEPEEERCLARLRQHWKNAHEDELEQLERLLMDVDLRLEHALKASIGGDV